MSVTCHCANESSVISSPGKRTCSAGATDHQAKLDSLLDILLATELDLAECKSAAEALGGN